MVYLYDVKSDWFFPLRRCALGERDTRMTIDCKQNGTELTLSLDGRLDSTTSYELDDVVKKHIDGVTKLTFDFASMDYLSSAGLRVLLAAQKVMNMNEAVRDVFALTGMLDIFNVVP